MAKQRACEHTSYEVRKRWNQANLSTIRVDVKKEVAAEFKEKCAREGVTQAQILKKAIDDFLNDSTQNDKYIEEDIKPAEMGDFEPNTDEYVPDWLK